jgi:hypothetical protein
VSVTPKYAYNRSYAVTVARAIDILAATLWRRDYDITISSLCGLELRKAAPARWARILGAFLNWLETNHCELAIKADLQRLAEAQAILTGMAKP